MNDTIYIIDFDSTLVTVESLDELARTALADHADRARVMDELEAITAAGMTGEIAFEESLQRRLELFSAHRRHVQQLVADLQDHVSPSALARADWFADNAERIYVISGGFSDYIVPVVKLLGLRPDHVFANAFTYDDSGSITGFDARNLMSQPQGKVKQVAALKLTGPVVVIGDGYTDYEIRAHGLAEAFWAFTESVSRPNVTALAERVLASFDEVADA